MSDGLPEQGSPAWLERFYAGDRAVLAAVYTDHYPTVAAAVGGVLSGADREGVIHDVFLRLLESEKLRRNFTGGSLSAWLRQVAKNRAIDRYRARRRHQELDRVAVEQDPAEPAPSPSEQVEAALVDRLVQRFIDEVLPAKWRPVFDARFVRQLSQREAAQTLGMSRTTLAYQEARVRAALKRFIQSADAGLLDG